VVRRSYCGAWTRLGCSGAAWPRRSTSSARRSEVGTVALGLWAAAVARVRRGDRGLGLKGWRNLGGGTLEPNRRDSRPDSLAIVRGIGEEGADSRGWGVAEPPELFRLKCASHRYTTDNNSTHFKRTTHWSVGSPPDATTVQQDRSRFTSHEGEFTITQQLPNF
jgi:hypothetical protein